MNEDSKTQINTRRLFEREESMGVQDRTKVISKHLFKQIDNELKLNYHTPDTPKNMLESSLQNCKSFAKLSAISVSAIGMLLTVQSEKAQAFTSTSTIRSFFAESAQSSLNWEDKFRRTSKFFALKRNPLPTLNIDKNKSSTSSVVKIDEQVKTDKAENFRNSLTFNNSYNKNLSSTEEPPNNESLILSETKPKEYIFQIPSFETTKTQQDGYLGSKLPTVKNTNKQIYIVKQGDTLNKIASHYGTSRQQLIEQNNIKNPDKIFVAQQIKIPQTQVIVAQNKNQTDNSPQENFQPQLSGLDNSIMENYDDTTTNPLGVTITLGTTINPELPPLASPEQYLPTSPAAEFNGYVWPARGTLTSGYGWRWGRAHRGIDIAAPIGTPIVAAASGEVISAGWNSGGYGKLVKVKHPNGSVTFYAHNHRIMVRRGQKVKQGQQIAQMGSTGRSTGSHLHFEIRSNGQTAVNPIAYLPKK